jgi:hypothetical protein
MPGDSASNHCPSPPISIIDRQPIIISTPASQPVSTEKDISAINNSPLAKTSLTPKIAVASQVRVERLLCRSALRG